LFSITDAGEKHAERFYFVVRKKEARSMMGSETDLPIKNKAYFFDAWCDTLFVTDAS
jgi:hypothetical protein